jgi:hypothetical protein
MENVDTAMREGRAGDGKGRVHDIGKNLVEIISIISKKKIIIAPRYKLLRRFTLALASNKN